MRWFWNAIDRLDWPVLTLELWRSRRSNMMGFGLLLALYPSIVAVMLLLFIAYERLMGQVLLPLDIGVLSGNIVDFLMMAQASYVFVVIPIYASRTISAEREAGTFDALALTPLSAVEILVQKMAPIFLQLALFAATSLFAVLVLSLLRLNTADLATNTIVFFVVAVQFLSIAIWCSSYSAISRSATLLTYLNCGGMLACLWTVNLLTRGAFLAGSDIEYFFQRYYVFCLILVVLSIPIYLWRAASRIELLRRTR